MNSKKFVPSWMNNKNAFMSQKEVISEEKNLEKLRNEYAEIIMDVFRNQNFIDSYNEKYHQEMIDDINENIEYINDFIERDNIRLRDAYLNNEIIRSQTYLDNIVDYTKMIDDSKIKKGNNKLKIQEIMLEIDNLSKKMEEIKKNRPYLAPGKTPVVTKEEADINNQIEKLPHEKNKLEEENEMLKRYIEHLIDQQVSQDDLIIQKHKYIEYINENWDEYYHDGSMIILPYD